MASAARNRQSSSMGTLDEAAVIGAVRKALHALREEVGETLGDALTRYEREYLPGLAPATQDWRRRAIVRLRERFGTLPINRDWVPDAHRLHADGQLTSISAAMACNTLGRVLSLAFLWRWVDEPPRIGKLGWIRGEGKDLPYRVEDLKAIFSALSDLERQRKAGSRLGSRSTCGLRFLGLTGWRPSEVTWLRWPELLHDGRVAQLPRTKTGPQSRVLSAAAIRVIQRRPRKPNCPYVFWGRRLDHGVTKNAMRATLAIAAKMVGVENPGLRRFRYTTATMLLKGGFSDAHTERLLGHANIRQSRSYQLVMFDELSNTANALADLILDEDEYGGVDQ
jgi:integrase